MNILYFLTFLPLFYSQTTWSTVDQILQAGIANQTYPGCTALVATLKDGIVYQKAFGNYTYGLPPPFVPNGMLPGSNPPMQLSTLFDLASCSKVFATTTVVALLYQNKYLQLETRVSDATLLGSNYSQNGKGNITVLNLLLHNSGYPPDPSPNYYEKSFGCPASQGSPPHPEDFTCRTKIYNSILAQTLQYPTGTQMIYSDLSFMTLMFVAGKIVRTNNLVSQSDLLPACMVNGDGDDAAQCYYEAYVRQVFKSLGLNDTGYLPSASRAGDCAPTENDTNYESGFWGPNTIQGVVSDGNGYILGGVGGHAGFFSNVLDLAKFLQEWMWGKTFRPDVVQYFTTQYNKTQSSRALGWDTNDGSITDYGSSQVCGANMSSTTFLHTGYTGTMVCGNPKSNYFTLLLTTRVYPTDSVGSTPINNVRRAFSQAIVDILGP